MNKERFDGTSGRNNVVRYTSYHDELVVVVLEVVAISRDDGADILLDDILHMVVDSGRTMLDQLDHLQIWE